MIDRIVLDYFPLLKTKIQHWKRNSLEIDNAEI